MAPLPTTTIGSLGRLDPDLHRAIDLAVQLQVESGMDIITDGEQRADMVSYFAEAFEGLGTEDGAPVVLGRIALRGHPDEFSKVQDLDYILSKHPGLKVKVAITGPTTLGMTCGSRKIKSYYRSLLDFRMYEDIAQSLAPIAKAITDRGASVQIDEPFLSQGYKDLKTRVELLDVVADGLPREMVTVHVCGFIGKFGVVEHLLRLENVSVLSFAFAGRVEMPNIEHMFRRDFEDSGMRLGAGCISVTPMSQAQVDSPQTVASRLADIAARVGRENIAFTHPDCGMRATDRALVPIILKNLRAGTDMFG
ncbi:MAG: hypothetical protein QXJ32_05755 [Thermoplasmata archaeon]